jgi:hypothetical protein
VDAVVNGTANYFNLNAFSHPSDQIAGTAPRYFSNCRIPGIHTADISIAKDFHISESKYFQIRGDLFNALNTPRFASPGVSYGTNSFGVISSQVNQPRHGQVGIRFVF